MKKIILLILILKCGIINAQNEFPFFEQIAFDFYQTKIIDSFPVKKKIKVYRYVTDFHFGIFSFHNVFSTPNCLTGITWKSNDQFKEIETYTESQMQIDSNRFELDFSNLNKKKFKIKKNGKGRLPKLFITPPNLEQNESERIFVNIFEKHLNKNVYYHFEFNSKGEIIDWCRSVSEIIRIY